MLLKCNKVCFKMGQFHLKYFTASVHNEMYWTRTIKIMAQKKPWALYKIKLICK